MFIKYKKKYAFNFICILVKDKSQCVLSLTRPNMAVSIMNSALIFSLLVTQTIFIKCLRMNPVKEFEIVSSLKFILIK